MVLEHYAFRLHKTIYCYLLNIVSHVTPQSSAVLQPQEKNEAK